MQKCKRNFFLLRFYSAYAKKSCCKKCHQANIYSFSFLKNYFTGSFFKNLGRKKGGDDNNKTATTPEKKSSPEKKRVRFFGRNKKSEVEEEAAEAETEGIFSRFFLREIKFLFIFFFM